MEVGGGRGTRQNLKRERGRGKQDWINKMQKDISLATEKMRLTSDTLDNSSTDQHSAIKTKILNSTGKIRKN